MRSLSLSILDLVQNSVRCGASLVEIAITKNESENLLTISVKDNGCGMDKSKLEMVTDPFFTTCKTHKVGLGIPLFVQRALLTGGSYRISSEKGSGTEISACFKTNSVNFVPLGDISDTLRCLVISVPETDFLYTFCADEYRFILDTKAIYSQFGVKADTAPFIKAALIKEYLAEEIIQ